MEPEADRRWWEFSIGGHATEPAAGPDTAAAPDAYAGRYSYRTYIALDRILTAQATCTTAPDERVFLLTHQLIELTFKLMIFDLAVIARTCDAALEPMRAERLRECLADDVLWRPATTASARVLFSARTILPSVLRYLTAEPDCDATLDRTAYFGFRDKLGNSSGIQSAQFRLLQRAFAKSPVLELPLFTAAAATSETGAPPPPVAVIDPVLLEAHAPVASPQPPSPLARVAALDDTAHGVLARVAMLDPAPAPVAVDLIGRAALDRAVNGLAKLFGVPAAGRTRAADASIAASNALSRQLEQRVAAENARRTALSRAWIGARYLKTHAPGAALTRVLQRIVDADEALHGRHASSVLSTHLAIARTLLAAPADRSGPARSAKYVRGTAGGSVAYLGAVRNLLLPLFPAVVAFRHPVTARQ